MTLFAKTMLKEADAIREAIGEVAPTYNDAIPHLVCRAPVIFSGMGKSGLVAQKAAATFRSLGVPSHYVHPGDASHGDLGAYTGDAVAVLLSNSGKTEELGDTILFCRDNAIPIIAITGDADSPLAQAAHVVLCYGYVEEACPNGLAPTTSTTVAMSVCDALAVDVADQMKVRAVDFKRYHPGGKLGNRVLPVSKIVKGPVPVVKGSDTLYECALAMTGDVSGIAIVRIKGKPHGVLTDGDLRRNNSATRTTLAAEIMNPKPLVIPDTTTIEDAALFMNEHRITKVLVEDALYAIIGIAHLHDCE